jgi:hypothetical protein
MAYGFIALFFLKCSSVIDDDQYDVEGVKSSTSIALPLAYGDLTISDLLNDQDSTFLKVYPDGLLYLAYEQELQSRAIGELLEFPDREFNRNVAAPEGLYPATTAEVKLSELNSELGFNFDPEKLAKFVFEEGQLEISTKVVPASPINFDYAVIVALPDFKNNGIGLSQKVIGSQIIDLKNYEASFVDNVTPVNISLIKRAHNETLIIPNGTRVEVTLSFGSFKYKFVEGFFGDQTTLLLGDSLATTVFENSLDKAAVSFAEPKGTFEAFNEYGMPVKVNFTTFEARRADGSSIPVAINTGNSLNLNFPKEPGSTAITTAEILNIRELLDFKPISFNYSLNARINAPSQAELRNFAHVDNEFRLKLKLEVPLFGKASVEVADTLDIDVDDLEESEIESASLRIRVVNELPLQASLQILLADENYKIIETLIPDDKIDIIKGSVVTSGGDLQSAGIYEGDILISKEKLNKLFDSSYIILRSKMLTVKEPGGAQGNVKFKTSYKMKVNLGLKADLKINIDL